MYIPRKTCLAFLIFIAGNAIIPDTKEDYKMVVTWGEPLQARGATVYNISWSECLQKCWEDPSCVLIHDISPTCAIYNIEGVQSVQKLPPTSDSRVAFRIINRNQTCSDPNLDPLLSGGTIQSDVERDAAIYVNNQYIPYNITLENDVWKFTQRPAAFSCIFPTRPVRRGNMIWCMMVRATGRCLDRSQAETDSMDQFQQPIAGPANQEEFDFLKESAMAFLTVSTPDTVPPGYSTLGFWVDGKRKTDCKIPRTSGVNCSGTNEFDFSDSFAQTPVLKWLSGQPDDAGRRTGADCIYFLARKSNPAGIDDFDCTYKTFSPLGLCMVGYYSGRILGPDTWD